MKVHINMPFWGAWSTYGWWPNIPGLGFKKVDVDLKATDKKSQWVYVTIGQDPSRYKITAKRIQALAYKYNSEYKARFDTILYVIPQIELKKIK